MEYFINFPTTTYNNVVCTDITRRVGILPTLNRNAYAFAPYDVKEGQRADQVADLYYGDESREWLVWLSSDIIDPYGQWSSSQDTLEAYITARYGSVESAQLLTHHYALDWGFSDETLSLDAFSTLHADVQSLYAPTYDDSPYANIIGYTLRRDDIRYSTNLIMTVGVDNPVFSVGDYVTFGANGHAEVVWANTNTVKIQHVENDEYLSGVITRHTDGSTANVMSVVYTSNTIPTELRYLFSPVSLYDYEINKNASYKTIRLIDKKYVSQAEKELIKELT